MIRDRIVTGCTSEKCREKHINEGDKLTMDKAIQIVQNFEYCQKQLSTMTLSGATGTSVDVIHDATHRRSTGGARPKTTRTSNANSAGRSRYQQPKSQQTKCGNCGTYHKIKECPAFECVTIVASATSKNCADHDLYMTLTIKVNVTMCILGYNIVT